MTESSVRLPLSSLKRLFRKEAPEPQSAEEQFKRLLREIRGLRVERRHELIRAALAAMTDRDAIDLLQDLAIIRPLDYAKAEVLLHTETRSAYLRRRAALKEPWTIAWLESCLAADEVLYDVGANVGVYSLLAAGLHGPGLRVVAFEPAFANFADLNRNIVLNGLEGQVVPLPFALTEADHLLSFGLRNLQAGAALHGSDAGKGGEGAAHVLPVVGRPLDALVESLRLPLPQHVKIDVDGGELEVLEGGGRTLAAPGLKTVMIEITATAGIAEKVETFFAARGLTKAREFHKAPAQGDQEGCWYGLYARDPAAVPGDAFEDLVVGR